MTAQAIAQPTPPTRIGCAGWSVPKDHAARFPAEGSHLERYAGRLNAVEINSSFYRPHRPATYARWAASVPEDFQFAVKVPRQITHERRLADATEPLEQFLAECGALGPKLGPLLVQLPPSLGFDPHVALAFFDALRARFPGPVVCEPRHPTWFGPDAERLLTDAHVARVAADPASVPPAALPGGWPGLVYYRWHGSPQIYYSDYPDDVLGALAETLRALSVPAWCIFDNTALGHAAANALSLAERLATPPGIEKNP